jgi:hypothetical protein
MHWDAIIVGASIIIAGVLISGALQRVEKQLDLLRVRFCEFAFAPSWPDKESGYAATSQLRWIVRAIHAHKTGDYEAPGN